MTREDRQEALSLAYIKAVAAFAGMTHSTRSRDYGIDLTLHEIRTEGIYVTESGLQLDIQAKSTMAVVETPTEIRYDLDIRAYQALRRQAEQERILAILILPREEAEWVRQSRTKLELRKCVYWVSLRGRPAVKNRSSVRIVIPRRQVFTADALRGIMDRISRGEPL